MSVYEPDNFRGRVELAASYIAQGRNGTRSFDTCFEMYDGDAVAVALYRRAQANPDGKLAANIWRYLGRDSVEQTAGEYANVKTQDLPDLAAQLRDWREKASQAMFAYMDDVRARPNYHDGTPRKKWHELGEIERESWIRNPTPRENFRTELTDTGEQTVIPGCERNDSPKASQLELFG